MKKKKKQSTRRTTYSNQIQKPKVSTWVGNSNVCESPKCDRNIIPDEDDEYGRGSVKEGLCSRCMGAVYYWNRRLDEDPDAIHNRLQRVDFLTKRLKWLFDE